MMKDNLPNPNPDFWLPGWKSCIGLTYPPTPTSSIRTYELMFLFLLHHLILTTPQNMLPEITLEGHRQHHRLKHTTATDPAVIFDTMRVRTSYLMQTWCFLIRAFYSECLTLTLKIAFLYKDVRFYVTHVVENSKVWRSLNWQLCSMLVLWLCFLKSPLAINECSNTGP